MQLVIDVGMPALQPHTSGEKKPNASLLMTPFKMGAKEAATHMLQPAGSNQAGWMQVLQAMAACH